MANKSLRPRKAKKATAASSPISLSVILGLPEIRKGHDLAKLIAHAARRAGIIFRDGDVLVVAQKIISKAEGRIVQLSKVRPSRQASDLAKKLLGESRF